jgi:tetratricopeptide (TPR) repeat protein
MSPIFEGLYFHEVVLLVLGVVLFIVLVIGFFYQLVHKRSIAALLPFFSLPISMIGFSSVKSIQYKDGLINIDKTTRQLQENPTDANLRQTLQQQVAKIGTRPSSNPQNAVVVAKAQYALGDETAAKSNLQKATQANPTDPSAHELQRKIAAVDNLKQLTSQVEADPANSAAKARLARTLDQTSQMKLANPDALTQVARAQTALGENTKALENTQKVLAITPNSPAAHQLQNTIKARMISHPP